MQPGARPRSLPACLLPSAAYLAAAGWMLWDFPLARWPLAGALAACFVLVLAVPRSWLAIVPAAMVAVDLTPWSGRWLFTEFDMLVLVTLAALAWERTPAPVATRSAAVKHLLVFVTLLAWCAATAAGLDLDARFDPSEFAAHRGPYEGLRALKPVLYAVLLLGPLRRALAARGERAAQALAAGFCIGLVLLGLWVMWDRGVLAHAVHWRDLYALAGDLLDISSTYRTTGPFAGMHTGGVAIDAYLLLALPFALALLMVARSTGMRVLALAGFALGCYALLGTFSRATYAGFALLIVLFAVVLGRRLQRSGQVTSGRLLAAVVLLLGASAMLIALYPAGGFQALGAGALGFVGGALCVAIHARLGALAAIASWGAGSAAVIALCFDAIANSKWHEPPSATALLVLLGLAASLPLLGAALAWALRTRVSAVSFAGMLAAVAVGWMLAVPAASGYRMEARFSQVFQDLGTRDSHWRDAAALRGDGLRGVLFGAGAGSFARNYFWRHLGETGVGSFRFIAQPHGSFLRLGEGDYNLMQRVPVRPDQRYTLSARMRTDSKGAAVNFKLCHKNVLYSERYTPNCPVARLGPAAGEGWQVLSAPLDSGVLGRYGAAYWPVTLLVPHPDGGVVDVTEIRLLDESGVDLVANGSFERGADRWFFISDYSHLPWHAKNLLLHLWIEQGVLGLAAFLALAGAAWMRSARHASHGGLIPVAVLIALPALGVLSLFGTIVDFPRVVLPLYLVLFAALYARGEAVDAPGAAHPVRSV